jgi:hypothetical protein
VSGEQPDDQLYSDEEAQRRFEALVRAVLSTPPRPLKDMPRKRAQPKADRGRPAKSSPSEPS